MNNLRDVHRLYCPDSPRLHKATRDVFVEGTLGEIKENFQRLMTYCAQDVIATSEVVCAVYPIFLQRCPHPATLGENY